MTRVEPGTISNECPFEWNWARGQRDSLLNDGLLTAIIFGHAGKVVGYLELRRDEVEFSGADGDLTPETAVFSVERPDGDEGAVRLSRQQ